MAHDPRLAEAEALLMAPPLNIIFIAGPYIGDGDPDTIEANIQEAKTYAVALANAGIGFFCPHLHTAHFGLAAEADETFYHRLDFQLLARSQAALFTPRWQTSGGARREEAWATWRRMPRFYPKSPTDLEQIRIWNTRQAQAPFDLEQAADEARTLLFEMSGEPGWTPQDEASRQRLRDVLARRRIPPPLQP